MLRKTTIYDIAKKLNITAATVSRALNNNPRISATTRKLVLETAADMNYEPNKLALALKYGKSFNVGVVVPYIDRNFFSSIIRGIEDELYPHGYQVVICQTHEDSKREKEIINALVNAQIDGIMLSISKNTEDTQLFRDLSMKNIPLIFFDRTPELKGISSVTIDDHDGGYQATCHLISQGCKRIAHLTVDLALDIYRHRCEGYRDALQENNIPVDENLIMEMENSIEGGQAAVSKLMSLPGPPDALYASSDFLALGAIQKLQELGVRIPDSFCVVGFSNEPFTKFMELSISSVDQSPVDMGRLAARVFLEKISDSTGIEFEKKVVLPAKLHIRKSSSR